MLEDMPEIAKEISDNLDKYFPTEERRIRQVLVVMEECGEFAAAFRRANGMARQTGSWKEVREELADVIISAFVAAHVLNIDLECEVQDKIRTIMSRGGY
ncbi:MAG: MazG nucleotide pyrophosphohydrolase domain-containing protein [Candidatus Dormibacteraceae bacterium]